MEEEVYQDHLKTVDNLYIVLQLIEDRFNVAQETFNVLYK